MTVDEPELAMRDAVLTEPRPVQARIPLTLGTANSRMLRWAGEHADVVGLTGFGRTLADGHRHEARWSVVQVEEQLRHVTQGAMGRATAPELEALVQQVVVTDDAEAALAGRSGRMGLSVDDLLAVPFVLVGTEDGIVAAVREHGRRWGVTRFVVREDAIDAIAPIVARLRD